MAIKINLDIVLAKRKMTEMLLLLTIKDLFRVHSLRKTLIMFL